MFKLSRSCMARVLLAVLLAALFSVASAQIDERARTLMEGLAGGMHDEVNSLQMRLEVTTFPPDGDPVTMIIESIVDYVERRAVINQSSEAMGGFTSSFIISGDQITMSVMGMEQPVPPELAGEFSKIFDLPEAADVFGEDSTASFDGAVNYGDLLAGDQVTYSGKFAVDGVTEVNEVQYVFNAAGELLGVHFDTGDGEVLMVYAEPVSGNSPLAADTSMYMNENGKWEPFVVMEYSGLIINGSIDDSLFD
jgi:hypothetical protein